MEQEFGDRESKLVLRSLVESELELELGGDRPGRLGGVEGELMPNHLPSWPHMSD